jgi:6,7-dimethyl-8-ribityllumazine synthase
MAEVSNSKLFNIDTGILDIQDACIVIVKTEWNSTIVDELEAGCRLELEKSGVNNLITITVPGAFEIPFAIKSYFRSTDNINLLSKGKNAHAFIALGAVVRGDTPHFDYVCKAVTDGVVQLNLELPVPVIFGVLTVDNEQQAIERIGGKHGHKGVEAAITALKMISLVNSFNKIK